MAQRKTVRKKATKPTTKKSAKKPLSKLPKTATKPRVKGKTTRSENKKKSTTAKKSKTKNVVSKKVTPKKAKVAKNKKSTIKSAGKKKRVSLPVVKLKKNSQLAKTPKSSANPFSPELTATERYNLGGLFVCAIERETDPDCHRLRAVLRELRLPSLEKDNLIRLSQGLTIPKLFADGIALSKTGPIVERMVKFAAGEGGYERKWKNDIRQVAAWLGMFGSEVEVCEQRVGAK